jgi:D-alanyl-lipoteichoic acid acyltransferase DltB (MBOAT superfamily)
MRKIILFFQAVLLAIWLGGMFLFSMVLAPTAFAVLPTRDLAGLMVGTTLQKVNIISCSCIVLLVLLTLLSFVLKKKRPRLHRHILIVFALISLSIALYAGLGIDPRMHTLRTRIQTFSNQMPDDPLRLEFDRLHRRSVNLFGINLVLGVLILGLWVKDLESD